MIITIIIIIDTLWGSSKWQNVMLSEMNNGDMWWIMQPKEQGVLMWETGNELEFLPQRKASIYQPDLGQIVFANITLHCLIFGSFTARSVPFATICNGNHSRQFRRISKVHLLNELSGYCREKLKSLQANTCNICLLPTLQGYSCSGWMHAAVMHVNITLHWTDHQTNIVLTHRQE